MEGPPTIAEETLADTAEISDLNGFSQLAQESVDLSVDAIVSLAIEKTIPDILQGVEKASFTFIVCKAAGENFGCVDDPLDPDDPLNPVRKVEFNFAAGETQKSATVSDLPPGVYLVYESDTEEGWGVADDQYINLPADSLQTCSGSLTFDNWKPSITFDKTGDELSKIGDPTDFTITLTNTSTEGTPDLTCTVTDEAIGVDETVTLAAGDPAHVINAESVREHGQRVVFGAGLPPERRTDGLCQPHGGSVRAVDHVRQDG